MDVKSLRGRAAAVVGVPVRARASRWLQGEQLA